MLRMFLIAVLATGFAYAQPPRGFFPWWDRPIAKDLNLTDTQSRQIRSTIRDYRSKLIDARASLEKAELELQNAFEEDSVDTARANQAIENLAKARENLTRTVSQMALQLRLVLTPEQWQQVQKKRADRGLGGSGQQRRQNRRQQQ